MNKRKKSKLVLVIVSVLLVYFVYILINQQNILNNKNREMKIAEAKVKEELKLNEDLKKQKKDIKSDSYIEKIAREKLGMVKSGERIYFDIDK